MESGVLSEAYSLILRGRANTVYTLPSSYPTLSLILVEFIEFDDHDDNYNINQ
ncbi:hypothetical protein Hanom_Chr10g00943861 [Helianthus anomalus]